MNKILILFTFISFVFISCNTSDQSEVFSYAGTTMGTTYSIKIVELSDKAILPDLQIRIDSVLVEVNRQMSTYIKDSEISLFNSSHDTSWFKVSKDFAVTVNDAINISKVSTNFYDITIGPIVNLWGFGPQAMPQVIPSDEQIAEARKFTGISKLMVNEKFDAIKKSTPNLYCDLSSIAKGFGVDKVSYLLNDNGYNNYMVEIGGEVRTKGKNLKKEKWKIGIPSPNHRDLQKVIGISNVSVATSGDYLNYFEKDGVRYSHLIDPTTGRPISHNLASVTVVNNDCRTADALATAINVMGPELGYEFALEKKLPIFMIVRENNSFIEKMTPQFEEFIIEEN